MSLNSQGLLNIPSERRKIVEFINIITNFNNRIIIITTIMIMIVIAAMGSHIALDTSKTVTKV